MIVRYYQETMPWGTYTRVDGEVGGISISNTLKGRDGRLLTYLTISGLLMRRFKEPQMLPVMTVRNWILKSRRSNMGGYAHNKRSKAAQTVRRLNRITVSQYPKLSQREKDIMAELKIKPKLSSGKAR